MLALGRRLGQACAGGAVVYLVGDLGAGKTTLVRGMLGGLGHGGAVRSPTFTLVEPYECGPLRVYHLDLYRLADPEELEYLGVRDYLDPGVLCLVEWPARGRGHLPPADLEIRIGFEGPGRRVAILALTPAGRRVLDKLERPA
jgi:tRNA threonylcarbamoyladenosine biosynthesis protein TsaE